VTQIKFEKMHTEHLPQVLDIYTYYVLNTTATFHISPPQMDEMARMVFFDNPRYQTFVILDGEIICGYVLLTQFKNREAYDRTAEVTLYVRPDYAGMDIGSKALQHVEEFAHTRDIRVLAATICGDNQHSINLFVRNGYSKCAHYRQVGEKFGQLLDVVAYQKNLD
jgi:L-amino acid N-acyltransferase YncA